MKKVLLLVLALLLCFSVTALADELLFNGDFEFADAHDAGWQVTGSDGVRNLTTCLGNPGPPTPEAGIWGLTTASAWGRNENWALQEAYVAPDVYNVTLSGWLRVDDGGVLPSMAELILFVDDVEVRRETLSLSGPSGFGTTQWQQKSVVWAGAVNGKLGAQVHLVGDGQGGPSAWPFGIAYADAISLTTSAVPEPASMLALVAGLGGLIIRRRK